MDAIRLHDVAASGRMFEAMETTGIHFREIKKRLTAIGVEPWIRREDVGAAFYRKSDLRRL